METNTTKSIPVPNTAETMDARTFHACKGYDPNMAQFDSRGCYDMRSVTLSGEIGGCAELAVTTMGGETGTYR
jgi:hypothetical protein